MSLKNTAHKKLLFSGKIVILGVLVYFLFKHNLIQVDTLHSLSGHTDLLFLSSLFLFIGILIGAIRWKLLIVAAGIDMPWKLVFQLYLIGSFFSSYLPGAVGGDAIRAFYIYRLLDSRRSTAFLTLLADRLFSLFGLLSAAGIVYIFCPATVTQSATLFLYGKVIFFLLFCAIFLTFVCFALASVAQDKKLYNFLPARISPYIQPVISIVLLYRKKWLILFYCWLLSVSASGVVAIGIMEFASFFTFNPGSLVSLIAGIFGNLSSAIPLTPGGIGVSEVVFAKVCTDLSGVVAPFATIYFVFRLAMLFVNIPGLIVYLLFNFESSRESQEKLAYLEP